MKRAQMGKKVNSNNNSIDHFNRKVHLNTASPDIVVGQIWLQEDEPTAVEIIELNTSDEIDPSTDEALENRLDHAWSYTNNERLQQIEDNYNINMRARERRRLNYENHLLASNTSTNTNNQFSNNNFYSDIEESEYIEDSQFINHQVNCFTIINKHFIDSDSSSDADDEIVNSNDTIMELHNRDAGKSYDEDIITYDPELDKETRTIWIYSFKNKHLLSDNDFELNNIAAKDMSSSSTTCSTESDEQHKDKSVNVRRLGSPVPPAYIPRLNLSIGPTLSTVTEVSEPYKQTSSNSSYKSPTNRLQKQRNSWFPNENLESGKSVGKLEKSTNIVNWMALSPREKRRRSKEQGDKWEGSLLKLESLPTEEQQQNRQQQTQNSSRPDESFRLQVDVDVHVSVNEKSPDKKSLGTPNADVILKFKKDDISPISLLKHATMNITGALDRGDHDRKFEQSQQIMCLTGSPHIYEGMHGVGHSRLFEAIRTAGPILNLNEPEVKIDPELWAREEKEETETASYDYLTNKLQYAVENADKAWLENNAPFLKPSEWSEYKPIAESPLSIQLSIADIENDRQPWFKRFIKKINCCK